MANIKPVLVELEGQQKQLVTPVKAKMKITHAAFFNQFAEAARLRFSRVTKL